MIDFNTIKVSLQEWIVRSTSLIDEDVMFSDQAEIRPGKPYITMKVSSIVNIGLGSARSSIDDLGFADYVGNKEFTLLIQCFGTGALDILSILNDSLEDETELQVLRDNKIVFVEQLLFEDMTELLETTWEERAQLDLLFRTTSISNHEVGIIERVYLESNYKNTDGSLVTEDVIAIQDPNAIAGHLLTVQNATIDVVSDEVEITVS